MLKGLSEEIPEQAEVGGLVRDREPVWVVCGVWCVSGEWGVSVSGKCEGLPTRGVKTNDIAHAL